MPQPPQITPLIARLQNGIASSAELAHALGVSQPSISRRLARLTDDGQLLRIGLTRGARYGLRREIEGIGSNWPLRRIDRKGDIHEIGTLHSLAAGQYFFDPHPGALESGFAWGGISEGIPYFLQDQHPSGFLGRAVPRSYPELNLPQRVIDWTDDHYLRYLAQRGAETVSNLVLGDVAFNEYLGGLRHRTVIQDTQRETLYPALVAEVMRGGLPGSSAHGEHPKFAAGLHDDFGPRSVIVKFSPAMDTPVGQRWGDLLIAEHHAHQVLNGAGLAACSSRIFTFANRRFLEVDRFDREGLEGRIGVTSLLAIDTAQYGKLDKWVSSAARLCKDRRIEADVLDRVRLVATFGALIANTDQHFGNLAFYDSYDGCFQLAPIYDMLPMLFAPEHDQIHAREFDPPHPTADTLPAWGLARSLAERYWRTLTEEALISPGFHQVSAACLKTLEALPRTGAYGLRE